MHSRLEAEPVVEPVATATPAPRLASLTLAALGIVYGDVGTSPLYALRACFAGAHAPAPTPANVLGVVSLVVWSLLLVISVKYLAIVMRAHNHGEGGILALLALVPRRSTRPWLVAVGLFGAALLYGDGVITPAISVLSAVEGLAVATPVFARWVVPITVVILAGLFAVQRWGTAGVGAVFGPVMLVWFVALGALGVAGIAAEPGVLAALDPSHGVRFFTDNGWRGFAVLGAVFLAVTGGEALYADMGHFGARPIRVAWFGLVLPALVIAYLGQGALLLRDPGAAEHPFFRLVPGWAHYPMVALSTLATVIASQAIIAGAFSLSRQAMQLGYTPRMDVRHTSPHEIGQIYVPAVNWMLMAGTIALVLGFGSSGRLAAAYGIAVSGTMAITSVLLAVVARELWHWSRARVVAVVGAFVVVEATFVGANVLKIVAGGWVPLVIAAAVYVVMTTWCRGRELLAERLRHTTPRDEAVVAVLAGDRPPRVPGTAVFLDRDPGLAAPAFLHNLRHNKVVHEHVVFLTVDTASAPFVGADDQCELRRLGHGIVRLVARYGFMESPDVPALLRRAGGRLGLPTGDASYFLSRDRLLASGRGGMARWRKRLFAFLARNAADPAGFFRLPPNRVVELGMQVEV